MLSNLAHADDVPGVTIRSPSMLTGGIALTCVGSTSVIGGVVMMLAGPMTQFRSFDAADKTVFDWGIPFVIAGLGSIVGGAFMAAAGGRHVRNISIAPSLSPTGGGLRFVARF